MERKRERKRDYSVLTVRELLDNFANDTRFCPPFSGLPNVEKCLGARDTFFSNRIRDSKLKCTVEESERIDDRNTP